MLAPLGAVSGGNFSAVGGFRGNRSADLLGKNKNENSLCVCREVSY